MAAHPTKDQSGWQEFGQSLTGPATVVTFVAAWWHCAAQYGFLLGFGLGWLPAAILAAMIGTAVFFAWPLALLGLGGAAFYGLLYLLMLFGLN